MGKQFIQFLQYSSGWIPISILALFTIALIAGQARANLPNEIKASPVASTSIIVVLNAEMLKRLESLPHVADMLLALPSGIEQTLDTRILSPYKHNDHSSPAKSQ